VIDIGGTTTDIGVVTGGFPRPASALTSIAGIRTNLRMPDVLSLGIGGGSHVRDLDGDPVVGPDSVGYELTTEALVFGGGVLTTSDLATAAGRADIGDVTRVGHLDVDRVRVALAGIDERIADAVDRLRTSADALPVVVVGGGSVLLPDRLPGVSELIRPEHASVANAVGAAIARIGGEVDRVFPVTTGRRREALEEAMAEAVARAEAAGARVGTAEVVEVEEIPLAYVPGGATRIKVKAVGEPDTARMALGQDDANGGTRYA
jgi:N-methylhydantoinase A/oxoprolinase/acetone carboxylase beta subunit